eukprot:7451884-Ditylum_brightwellii.AAC.1
MDVLQYLFQTYRHTSPQQVSANSNKMMMSVDPNKPITLIWKQIEDAQKFAMAAGNAFPPQQIVTAAETLMLGTNKYHDAYRSCLALPQMNKTYTNLK